MRFSHNLHFSAALTFNFRFSLPWSAFARQSVHGVALPLAFNLESKHIQIGERVTKSFANPQTKTHNKVTHPTQQPRVFHGILVSLSGFGTAPRITAFCWVGGHYLFSERISVTRIRYFGTPPTLTVISCPGSTYWMMDCSTSLVTSCLPSFHVFPSLQSLPTNIWFERAAMPTTNREQVGREQRAGRSDFGVSIWLESLIMWRRGAVRPCLTYCVRWRNSSPALFQSDTEH